MSSKPLLPEETRAYELRLGELRLEHRDLDRVITIMTGSIDFDQLQIRRLKKRKLVLKDQIIVVENLLIPDIDA